MKKVVMAVISALSLLVMVSCSDTISPASEDGKTSGFGSVVIRTAEKETSSRFIDATEITTATVNVWVDKNTKVSKSDISISGGKSGNVTIENIPTGPNRVIEVIGYKANGIEGKRLYYATNISSGENQIEEIKDGAKSARGKAYLALMNADVDVGAVNLTGFDSVSSSALFDAESFATSYKTDSSVSVSTYIQTAKTVTLSSIKNASGYSVWLNDPLSSKFTVSDNSVTVGEISDVAPGTWDVYVNDGTSTKKAGKVTVGESGGTFSETIGDAFAGKVYVFVKATYSNIYAWTSSTETKLNGEWPGKAWTSTDCSAYMKDATGWKMLDLSNVYTQKDEKINFIVTNTSGGKEFGDVDLKSGKSATFWFDGTNFYDSDPTANQLSSDATLSSISVNGSEIADFSASTVSYNVNISAGTESAVVTATANHENATVSVSPSASTAIAEGETKAFTITVTAEDGTTTKTYTVSVKRAAANDTTLASITVNGKAASISGTSATYSATGTDDTLAISTIVATAVDSNAEISYSATTGTVADGANKAFTITVTNGTKSAVYTLTVSYTKREPSQGQYGTNDKGFGVNKTISSWSDWTEAMQIARGAAYDDPRTWMGIQESPYDAYALYAAYDDTNLYLMVELTNLPDGRASFMNHNYAGSDNAWWDNRDCPLGFVINTGKGATSTSPTVSQSGATGPIWGAVNFTDSEGFDFLFYASSKFGYADHKTAFVGVGTPGLFKLNKSTGYFSYDADYCLSANTGAPGSEVAGTSGISVRYIRQCQVSSTVKFESTPTDNRGTSGQTGEDLMASETYTEVETNDLDMSYWYTIPLATLGIDKAYIESTGIGVRQLTPNGGSLMDCLPWDVSMVDSVMEPCSDDESTSHEKEDVDTITSPQARIGK